jgi:hypothetical protein
MPSVHPALHCYVYTSEKPLKPQASQEYCIVKYAGYYNFHTCGQSSRGMPMVTPSGWGAVGEFGDPEPC